MFRKNRRSCKHTTYKFEADFVADPIWCNDCGINFDIDEFPLTDELKEELLDWGSDYGKWIDLETDSLIENGLELMENHNEKGFRLFQEVKKQLGEKYPIEFVQSKF